MVWMGGKIENENEKLTRRELKMNVPSLLFYNQLLAPLRANITACETGTKDKYVGFKIF